MRRLEMLFVRAVLSVSLAVAAPTEADIAAGETLRYPVRVGAAHFLRARAAQVKGDVLLTVRGADGKVIESGNLLRYGGEEDFPLFIDAAGEYVVEVENRSKEGARFRLSIETRTPSEADRALARGVFVFLHEAESKEARELTATRRAARAAKHDEALALFDKAGDIGWQARVLHQQGSAMATTGESKKAVGVLRKAVELRRAIPNGGQELSTSIHSLALAESQLGNVEEAIRLDNEALRMREAANDRPGIALSLGNLGSTYSGMRDADRALPYLERALAISKEDGLLEREAAVSLSLGALYNRRNDLQKALFHHTRALELNRKLGLDRFVTSGLMNIGMIYDSLGEMKRAEALLLEAEALARKIGELRGLGAALYGLGGVRRRLKDFEGARRFLEESAQLHTKTGSLALASNSYSLLCTVYSDLGQWEKVKWAAEESLSTAKKSSAVAPIPVALTCLSNLARHNNDVAEEERLQVEALAIARRSGNRDQAALRLQRLSGIARQKKDWAASLAYMEESVALADAGANVLVNPAARAAYRANRMLRQREYVDLLMAMHSAEPAGGYAERAYAVVERSRARSLVEMIEEPAPLVAVHKDKEKQLLASIAGVQKELFRENVAAAKRAELRMSLSKFEADLDLLQNTSAGGIETGMAESWDAARTRVELAGADGVVLTYSLGDARSFAWAVTAQGVAAVELPGRKMIEERVGAYRKLAAQPVNALTAARSIAAVEAEASALYKVLIAPLEKSIAGKERVLIVPDGSLNYLPFEALGLIERARVAYAPSASAAGALLARGRQRSRARQTLLAFADPSLPGGKGLKEHAERGFDFTALPNARAEASAIGSLFPRTAARTFVGDTASESRLKTEALESFQYLHFAAHGYYDADEPARSGIVLAQSPDAGEDGFLQAREIMKLKLRADLVTLSACQTGLGKVLEGDGVQGLAKAFLYAGAQSVVVSLWNVNDAATAELMKRFYAGLKAGQPKDAAMREAKLGLMRGLGSKWRHPYYWAAFVVTGEGL